MISNQHSTIPPIAATAVPSQGSAGFRVRKTASPTAGAIVMTTTKTNLAATDTTPRVGPIPGAPGTLNDCAVHQGRARDAPGSDGHHGAPDGRRHEQG